MAEFRINYTHQHTGKTASYFFESGDAGVRITKRSFHVLCRNIVDTLPANVSMAGLRARVLDPMYALGDNFGHFKSFLAALGSNQNMFDFAQGGTEWRIHTLDSARTPFTDFMCYGDSKSPESLYRQFEYHSMPFAVLFPSLESQVVLKPYILAESAKRISANLGSRPDINLRELAAGTGQSMAVLLEQLRGLNRTVFNKTHAVLTDGFESVVEDLRRASHLQGLIRDGKVRIEMDNMLIPAQGEKADYLRFSYALSELPEMLVKKAGGQFLRVVARGSLKCSQDFAGRTGAALSVHEVAEAMRSQDYGKLTAAGITAEDVGQRLEYEEREVPIDFSLMEEGSLIKSILQKITEGISNTSFFLGLNAARNLEYMVRNRLNPAAGSFIEAFDGWDPRIIPNNKASGYFCGIGTCKSINFPFVRGYLEGKGLQAQLSIENWSDYSGKSSSYLGANDFYRWLKVCSRHEFISITGLETSAAGFEDFRIDLLNAIHSKYMRWEIAIPEEGENNPFVVLLRNHGFNQENIDRIFESRAVFTNCPFVFYSSGDFYKIVTVRNI